MQKKNNFVCKQNCQFNFRQLLRLLNIFQFWKNTWKCKYCLLKKFCSFYILVEIVFESLPFVSTTLYCKIIVQKVSNGLGGNSQGFFINIIWILNMTLFNLFFGPFFVYCNFPRPLIHFRISNLCYRMQTVTLILSSQFNVSLNSITSTIQAEEFEKKLFKKI